MMSEMTAAATAATVALALQGAPVVVTSEVITKANGRTTQGEWVEAMQGQESRGDWARPDKQGCRGVGYIYDVAGGRVISLKCDKRKAEVYDAEKASAEVEKRLPSRLMTAAFSPTGRNKTVAGLRCEEYSFSVKAPMLDNAVLLRSGTAWVARQGPGVEEFASFYRSAGNVLVAGSITTPTNALAMDRTNTEVYRQIAALGGLPCQLDMKLEVEVRGSAGGSSRKPLNFEQTIRMKSVDTSPLQPRVFEVPEGWKTMNK